MDTPTNVDQAKRMVEMFVTGDTSDVSSVVDVHYMDHQGLAGNPMQGPDAFKTVVAAARNGVGQLAIEIADLVAQGDRVVMRLLWRRERPDSEGNWRETIEILRFADGRAVEHWGARVDS